VTLPTASLGLPAGQAEGEVVVAGLFSAGEEERQAPDLLPFFEAEDSWRSAGAAGELFVRLSLAREVSDAWLVESLPSLLALKEGRPSDAAELVQSLDRWRASLDAGLAETVAAASGTAGRSPAEIAASVASNARVWQERRDAAIEAIGQLPRDDATARLAEAESVVARRALLRAPHAATIAAVAAGALGFLALLLLLVVFVRRRARPVGGAGSSPRSLAGPRLVDGRGAVFLLDRPVLTIGAAGENDFVVTLPGVSRRHARVFFDASGSLWLEDVGSRYGSKVNGVAVTMSRLANGDEIVLGEFRARAILD
jgi:hypothetical protein